MGINLSLYVEITSAVGGGSSFPGRQFINRMMTTNPLVPTGSIVTFSGGPANALAACLAYFGSTSEEYKRAAQYFAFVSKVATAPQAISFGRWANAATAPEIFGNVQTQLLADFTSISNGDFTLAMGAFSHHFTAIDFTAASSLTDVASILTGVIQAYSAGGAVYTSATVTWDSARGSFDLVGGATGAAVISVTAGGTHDIAILLGWLSGAIFSNGVAVESITTTLTNTAELSNNFGSFSFTYTAALNLTQIEEAGLWNADQNVQFMYNVAVTAANASAWSTALAGYSGLSLTLMGPANEYHEMIPASIQASTVFTNPNSVQSYNYQPIPILTATVSDTTTAILYNDMRVNFLGAVQSAGTTINFYQQGNLQGAGSNIINMGAYANEQWFANASADALINLQLALPEIPADTAGIALIQAALQSVINIALNNGTIVSGKVFSNAKIALIGQITNDPNAYRQIQNLGYWVKVSLLYETPNWTAPYTIVYADSEGINFIQGSDILL